MLDPTEAATVAEQFGVAAEQVRRDHLLSHLLAVVASEVGEGVIFFGGTALARTHLPSGRLSEDLDLLATTSRPQVAGVLERSLAVGVRREFGRLTWTPALTAIRDVDTAVLAASDGLTLRIQLLSPTGYPSWPTERREVVQRYTDAPPARLTVPTRAAFVAWKTVAWGDRAAPRDLYDLWGLAEIGAVDDEARELYVRYGPTNQPPASSLFDTTPTEEDWQLQLGGQTRIAVGPVDAAERVRTAWANVTG